MPRTLSSTSISLVLILNYSSLVLASTHLKKNYTYSKGNFYRTMKFFPYSSLLCVRNECGPRLCSPILAPPPQFSSFPRESAPGKMCKSGIFPVWPAASSCPVPLSRPAPPLSGLFGINTRVDWSAEKCCALGE